jgi:predicted phosphodiesterase
MIFISGDTHGGIDVGKLVKWSLFEFTKITEDDYLIICGDFGFIWEKEETKNEREQLDWLDKILPCKVLFVDGNHENFDRLDAMDEYLWHGGKIHKIRDSIFHLMRGQVFEIEGKKIFTMGGAPSADKAQRIARENKYFAYHPEEERYSFLWWAQELFSDDEIAEAEHNLAKHNKKVDYIITHCCPQNVASFFSRGLYQEDELTSFFDEVARLTKFKKWYFGHYHNNDEFFGQYVLLYQRIERIL